MRIHDVDQRQHEYISPTEDPGFLERGGGVLSKVGPIETFRCSYRLSLLVRVSLSARKSVSYFLKLGHLMTPWWGGGCTPEQVCDVPLIAAHDTI